MASLQQTTISDTGYIKLSSGTSAQRPGEAGQPAASDGQIRFNSTLMHVEWYDSYYSKWFPTDIIAPIATGGTTVTNVTQHGVSYRVHSFTTVGNTTFTVTRGGQFEYLIIAGGGAGGGGDVGAGGGAGGVLTGEVSLTAQSYTITVGAGGSGVQNSSATGGSGSNSKAFGLVAIGGGGGSGWGHRHALPGGSGGAPTLTGRVGGNIPGQGWHAGYPGLSSPNYPQPGGGGAGGQGFAPIDSGRAADGGPGICSLISGSVEFYAGGGGGGIESSQNPNSLVGQGGLGGGGIGGRQTSNTIAGAGAANTGSGGGGEDPEAGGAGGSGIVIVRYRVS